MPKSEKSHSSPLKGPYERENCVSYQKRRRPQPLPQDLSPSGQSTRIETKEEAYKLTFGKHSGKTLKEVHAENPEYINWLIAEEIGPQYAGLENALDKFHKDVRALPCQRDPDWKAPSLSSAPTPFKDRGDHLWISEWDAKNFFGLPLSYLEGLESAGARKFWLWHVWDCLKWHRDEKEANLRLLEFLDKNGGREQEAYDKLGLGVTDGFFEGQESDGESEDGGESEVEMGEELSDERYMDGDFDLEPSKEQGEELLREMGLENHEEDHEFGDEEAF